MPLLRCGPIMAHVHGEGRERGLHVLKIRTKTRPRKQQQHGQQQHYLVPVAQLNCWRTFCEHARGTIVFFSPGSSPGDQVPGIGSSITVEPNDSTAGSLSPCTTQSPLQSRKGPRVSYWAEWAPKARGEYEIDAWFAPPAPSLIL